MNRSVLWRRGKETWSSSEGLQARDGGQVGFCRGQAVDDMCTQEAWASPPGPPPPPQLNSQGLPAPLHTPRTISLDIV